MDATLVLANSGAGSADGESASRAMALLRSAGEVEVARPADDQELADVLDRRGDRRLVVAGGDGSLHRAVQSLYDRGELGSVVLGLIPLGTGNDFARGAGIPLDPEAAARLVRDGGVRDVDLILDDDDEVVVNNVHVGVSAEASRLGARWKSRLGKPGYGIGVVQAALARPLALRVEVDGAVVADGGRPVLEVSIGNGASVGGGLPMNPGADPVEDGLDVIVSFAAGLVERTGYLVDVLRARHASRGDVWQTGDAEEIVVSGDPFYASSDGEIDGPDPHRSWRRLKAAYAMVLPG